MQTTSDVSFGSHHFFDVRPLRQILERKPAIITGVHSNQDLMWSVKIGIYMGFVVHHGF